MRVEADGDRPSTVVVEDTGTGIATDHIDRIFEAFQQGTTPGPQDGSGLGLTIARALCHLMGCELSVSSQPGAGNQFHVSLPPAPARSLATLPSPVDEETAEEGQLVLVIDDEADARLLLEEQIRSFGMRVVSADSGLEGLRLARELKPDLVTLDLKMPGMDGRDTLRAFKANPGLRDVPVMVVSVIAAEARGMILGHVDLFGKPVDRDALEEAVRRNIRGRTFRALVMDDDADARLLLTTLSETAVEEVRTAADGVETLEVLEEFEPGVILLDLVMPRMDGMAFLLALRNDARHAHTSVLVVTSKELTPAETALLERSTAGVMRKGAQTGGDGELRDRLAEFLQRARRS